MSVLNEITKKCNIVYGVDITEKKRTRETYIFGKASFIAVIDASKLYFSLREISKQLNITHASVINLRKKTQLDYSNKELFNKKLNEVFKIVDIQDENILKIKNQIYKSENMRYIIEQQERKILELQEIICNQERNISDDRYGIFYSIPKEKIDFFIETRLKPYLIMNGIKPTILKIQKQTTLLKESPQPF